MLTKSIDNLYPNFQKGNITSLNCPEEVRFAENLINYTLGLVWQNLQDQVVKQMQFP